MVTSKSGSEYGIVSLSAEPPQTAGGCAPKEPSKAASNGGLKNLYERYPAHLQEGTRVESAGGALPFPVPCSALESDQ
jgi:hypothetical protein